MAFKGRHKYMVNEHRAIFSKPDHVILSEAWLDDMDEFTFRMRVFECLYQLLPYAPYEGGYRG